MTWFPQVRFYLRTLLAKRKMDEQLGEEIRTHVEMATEENMAKGLPPDEARYAALREFGNVAIIQERSREERGWVWLEQWGRDLGFALRGLRRSPGFSAVAVLALTLGIGAGTAVFSLANGILLRYLPVPNPQELRVLEWNGRERTMPLTGNFEPIGQTPTPGSGVLSSVGLIRADAFSRPVMARLREATKEVADLAVFGRIASVNALAGDEPFTTQGLMVSGDFFQVLGARLALGRGVEPAEDRAGAAPVVVISHAWWQRYYGGDDSVLGRTVTLNDTVFTIIGVASPRFTGVLPGEITDFFVPLAAAPQMDPLYAGPVNGQDLWWVQALARLKPGSTEEALLGAASGVFAEAAAPVMKDAVLRVRDGRAGLDWAREQYRQPLQLLLAVVGLVMLVTCANLAGLCLARGEARRHEFAVRAALGSGRGRLMRVALLENVVLALIGAGLGCGLAILGRDWLSTLAAGASEGLRFDTDVDSRVLGCSVVVALVTAVLSGLLPGWRAARVDPLEALKRGGSGTPRVAVARALVVLQIALALTVLVGAGLYGRSLLGLLTTDAGYRLDNRLVFRVMTKARPSQEKDAFHQRIQEALLRVPGVEAAGVASFKPMLQGGGRQSFFTLPGQAPLNEPSAVRYSVGESFFALMDIPLVEGRGFQLSDQGDLRKGATVVIVNEAFVREYLPHGPAVGQVLRLEREKRDAQIVGVIRNSYMATLRGAAVPPMVFFYQRQNPQASAYHIVRSPLSKEALLKAVRAAVATVDPRIPLGGPAMLDEARDKALREEHLMATLVGALGVLALGLACLGVYGLMAFVVTRSTRDIGVRMALGARPLDVGRSILREVLKLGLIGAVLGGAAALALGRLIESQLYGVSARDPGTLVAATGVLLGGTIAVALWPAWRAMRVNPLEALRAE